MQQLLEKTHTGKEQSDQLLWTLFHTFSFSLAIETSPSYRWDLFLCCTAVKQEHVQVKKSMG